MVKLPYSAIYIINQVKLRRLILGISARDLAERIGLVPQYISKIESMEQDYQYPLEMLAKIAEVLKCEVRDFYPHDALLLKNDGSNVLKEIISLLDIEIASKVIDGMIEKAYFEEGKSSEEVAKYLHVYGRTEAATVQDALDTAVANGKLSLNNGLYSQA